MGHQIDRDRYHPEYVRWVACPLCRSESYEDLGGLERERYRFGSCLIGLPPEGVRLRRCDRCDLLYKSMVPEPEGLSRIFEAEASEVWSSHGYRFGQVRDRILDALGEPKALDLLDIGSSDGAMLRTFEQLPGRRSGLDVAANPTCAEVIDGEYIEGFLEGPIDWSGRPYDAVVACDILEHLYDPSGAFDRLREFTKPGGVIFLQTGDGDYPERAGASITDWWYVALFEHHIFWTESALLWVAQEKGLDVDTSMVTRHKDRGLLPAWKRTGLRCLRALAKIPGGRPIGNRLTGRETQNLPDPAARDHLTAILRMPR